MLRPVVLVDGPNMAMTNLFATARERLAAPSGLPTGAMFGFLRQFRALAARVKAEGGDAPLVNVAWDSRPCWRDDHLAGYKASRRAREPSPEQERLMEEYAAQLPKLSAALELIGANQVSVQGWEADDIAGVFHRLALAGLSGRLVLSSNDKDWLQLVDDRAVVWQPMRERYVTLANFEQVTGCLSPREWSDLLCLTGDSGDDVPGCRGVGEKKGRAFLRGQMGAGKTRDAIEAFLRDPGGLALTRRLVDLRRQHAPAADASVRRGAADRAALEALFLEVGFNSLAGPRLDAWLEPFTGATT